MPDVLIIADTIRAPELRHEVPLAVPDPFFYAEVGGKRTVVVSSLESGRISELGTDLEVLTLEDAGIDALLKRGLDSYELEPRALPRRLPAARRSRARRRRAASRSSTPTTCARTGSSSPPTSASSTSAAASRTSTSSPGSAAPAAPSRRASPSASSCCAAPRARTASLTLDGEPLTCERIQLEVERAFGEHGAAAEEFIVSHGAQTAVGHDGGSGPIAADDVVLFDLFPRDRESACYSDFTRTFSLGPPSDELRRVPPAREGGARPGGRRGEAGREGERHPPPGLRLLPRARPQDPAAQGGGRVARRRLLPRDRPRRRARGARAAGRRAASRASRSSRAT